MNTTNANTTPAAAILAPGTVLIDLNYNRTCVVLRATRSAAWVAVAMKGTIRVGGKRFRRYAVSHRPLKDMRVTTSYGAFGTPADGTALGIAAAALRQVRGCKVRTITFRHDDTFEDDAPGFVNTAARVARATARLRAMRAAPAPVATDTGLDHGPTRADAPPAALALEDAENRADARSRDVAARAVQLLAALGRIGLRTDLLARGATPDERDVAACAERLVDALAAEITTRVADRVAVRA